LTGLLGPFGGAPGTVMITFGRLLRVLNPAGTVPGLGQFRLQFTDPSLDLGLVRFGLPQPLRSVGNRPIGVLGG